MCATMLNPSQNGAQTESPNYPTVLPPAPVSNGGNSTPASTSKSTGESVANPTPSSGPVAIPSRAGSAGLPALTHSRVATYLTCPRKHLLRYELGLRPVREERALRFGKAYHAALEAYDNLTAEIPDPAERQELVELMVRRNYDRVPDWVRSEDEQHDWQIECEKVVCLFIGHLWRWQNEPLEVVATEETFRLPIVNPETGGASKLWSDEGKIDRIVRLSWEDARRLAVQEYKTTSQDVTPGSDYWSRLRIDGQVSRYVNAARAKGHDVQAVLYDVTRKPALKPSQVPELDATGAKIVEDANGQRVFNKDGSPRQSADSGKGWILRSRRETPEEYSARLMQDIYDRPDYYYSRVEVARTEDDLLEARGELWQIQQQIREAQRTQRWPRNTSACLTMHGRCEFFDLCTGGFDCRAGVTPEGFVRVADVNPELTDTAA